MRVAAILLPMIAAACSGASASQDEDAGPMASRSFALSGFERVKLAGSDDVRVVAGENFAVEATGPQAVLDKLEIRVEGDTLVVGRVRTKGWTTEREGAVITVVMPVVRGATLAGSGNFTVATTAEDRFDANLAGSGDFDIAEVRAAETRISIAGSGDIRAAGRARTANYSIAWSGNIDARKLLSENLAVTIAGSGDIDAHTSGRADVRIVGSGDVTIAGTTDCKARKLGSGDVRCV